MRQNAVYWVNLVTAQQTRIGILPDRSNAIIFYNSVPETTVILQVKVRMPPGLQPRIVLKKNSLANTTG